MGRSLPFEIRVKNHLRLSIEWAGGDVQRAYDGTVQITDVDIRNAVRDALAEMGASE